jgi:hypothetical protein
MSLHVSAMTHSCWGTVDLTVWKMCLIVGLLWYLSWYLSSIRQSSTTGIVMAGEGRIAVSEVESLTELLTRAANGIHRQSCPLPIMDSSDINYPRIFFAWQTLPPMRCVDVQGGRATCNIHGAGLGKQTLQVQWRMQVLT